MRNSKGIVTPIIPPKSTSKISITENEEDMHKQHSKTYLAAAKEYKQNLSFRSKKDHLSQTKTKFINYDQIGIDQLKKELYTVQTQNKNMEEMIEQTKRRNDEKELIKQQQQIEKDFRIFRNQHKNKMNKYEKKVIRNSGMDE